MVQFISITSLDTLLFRRSLKISFCAVYIFQKNPNKSKYFTKSITIFVVENITNFYPRFSSMIKNLKNKCASNCLKSLLLAAAFNSPCFAPILNGVLHEATYLCNKYMTVARKIPVCVKHLLAVEN